MTKRNTYIVTAIVVAAVAAGAVVYANWDNIATMLGGGKATATYDTGWIELTSGKTATAKTYQVSQNRPADGPDLPQALRFGQPNIKSRWDSDSGAPITLDLGKDFPAGNFDVEMYLDYSSSKELIPQAEPLKIETFDSKGEKKDTKIIEDSTTGACVRDNLKGEPPVWTPIVNTNCSTNAPGRPKLTMEFAAGGSIKFSGTQGSINIGGVRIFGVSASPVTNVDIPKVSTNLNPPINSKQDITFRFTIKNTTSQPATDVFFYDTFMDGNLDGQISMNSTIGAPGGASATFTEILSGGECAGSPDAGGYCFMDLGGTPGKYDTIVGYLPTLEANASIPINITFKPDLVAKPNGFDGKTYTNYTGITSKEMNTGNATYPAAILEEIAHTNPTPWAWKTSSASVEVLGGVTPPGALLLEKTPVTQTIQPGAEATFEIKMGNDAVASQSHVFLWDTWADDNDFDKQVDKVWINIPGHTSGFVELTGAKSDYSSCGGTAELAACYLDIDADGAGDTVLLYTNQALGQFPLTKIFDLKFQFKETAPIKTYTNRAGITSREMNTQDPNYPNSFMVEQWNWILKEATVKLQAGGIVTPTATPTDKPHAKIGKTVAKHGSSSDDKLIKPGDTVEYTITLENDGNQNLTNMKVVDNFDSANLENISITSGARCEGVQAANQVCFNVGMIPAGTSIATPLKYTAKVKAGVANNAEINNNANCISDQFPASTGGLQETCHTSVMFKVNQIIEPAEEYKLWVNKDVDKSTAKAGDKLNYTTTGGNNGQGSAGHIWMIDSLLLAENGEVILPQIQQAIGKLSQNATIQDVQAVLEQSLGISPSGTSTALSTASQPGMLSQPGDVSAQYKNNPGDDATTGLAIPLSAPGQTILDLDRDGIKDTVIHLEDVTWAGATGGIQTLNTQKPYTSVRRDLAPGDYKIVNTALVVKTDTKEVYNDPAETTVKIQGNLEALPMISVTKTVSDTDETNQIANTASAGEAMTYTINYTNTGSGPAKGAFIEDDYDERYIKITDNGGAQDSGTALFWSLGNVTAGQTVTKTFKVTVNTDLSEVGANFKNIGTVGAQGQTNKSAETTTTVPAKTTPEDQPYLVQTKSVVNENGGAVEPGDTLRYTITIENKGKVAATNVSAEDILPSALENLKIVTIPTGAKDETSGNKIKITGFTVNAGASVQIVYTASVKSGTANGTNISNNVVVTTGTAGGRATSVATGRVGSAFTGPGTGAAEANLIEAGMAKAAETGANPLTTALVVIGLALVAGITTVILRRRVMIAD